MSAEPNYSILILDRPRPLRYTVRSLRLLEDRSGRNLGELLVSKAGLSGAVWLIWAALITADTAFAERQEPGLTIEDVSDLLQDHWFDKGHTLPELEPYYSTALLEAGVFAPRDKSQKKSAAAPLPEPIGSETGSTG